MRLLVNRTLTYSVLAVLIGAAYLLGVLRADALLGLSTDWAAPPQLVGMALVALAVQPVRIWVARGADRLVYGRRTPPYEVLAAVSAMSQGVQRPDEALRTLARIVAEGLGLPSATVSVELSGGTRVSYQWPAPDTGGAGAAAEAGTRHWIPLRRAGESIGALGIPADPRRSLARNRRRLLADLSRAAGVVVHNARLTIDLEHRLRVIEARSAEIRASRWRIVAAQDSERRELERDLHDGAQPGLTAVRLSLGLLAHAARTGDTASCDAALAQAADRATLALAGLRLTLRGLDPETLGRAGLVAALRERAGDLGSRAAFDIAPDVAARRFAGPVEAAVYYCCSEALQNVAKHCPDSTVAVAMTLDPGAAVLRFAVTDDGPGFDLSPIRPREPGGLANMADRINTVGGVLEITSAPGRGTVVAGWVPVGV